MFKCKTGISSSIEVIAILSGITPEKSPVFTAPDASDSSLKADSPTAAGELEINAKDLMLFSELSE
ncbi:hypothetical protein ACFLSQ_05630 [Bacteroidota bacterium]